MTETMVREHATAADTDTAAGFVVHVDVLRTLLAGALVAAGKDGTMPALCAVQLEWDAESVHANATDRYRLAVGRYAFDRDVLGMHGAPTAGTVLLARQDVERIVKGLPKTTARDRAGWTVRVSLPDSVIHAGASSSVLVEWMEWNRPAGMLAVGALDAQFPKWRTLIPTDDALSEGSMPLVVNPAYLADVAKLAPHKNAPVRIRTSATSRPAVLDYPSTADDASVVQWLYLLMPVRIAS